MSETAATTCLEGLAQPFSHWWLLAVVALAEKEDGAAVVAIIKRHPSPILFRSYGVADAFS